MTFHDVYFPEEQITVGPRLDDSHGACVDIGSITVTATDARQLAAEVIIAAGHAEHAAAEHTTAATQHRRGRERDDGSGAVSWGSPAPLFLTDDVDLTGCHTLKGFDHGPL